MLLFIAIFRLAPDHVSAHNNLGTLLENNEVWPGNFKTLFLLKDKKLNPRPDSNPEPPWVGLSILQATERLLGSRARPFIKFLCETFVRTVTTGSVDGETAGFLLYVPRHRLRTAKETTQPNNKAFRRTLFFGSFLSFVMTVPAERPNCRHNFEPI